MFESCKNLVVLRYQPSVKCAEQMPFSIVSFPVSLHSLMIHVHCNKHITLCCMMFVSLQWSISTIMNWGQTNVPMNKNAHTLIPKCPWTNVPTVYCDNGQKCPHTHPDMSTDRCAPGQMCPHTDVPMDKGAHTLLLCPWTDVPIHWCAHGQSCPQTDVPRDKVPTNWCAHGQRCAHIDVPGDKGAHTLMCPGTKVPMDKGVHTLMCPCTNVPTHWCAQGQAAHTLILMCTWTDVPTDRCAYGQMCLHTQLNVPMDQHAHGLMCPHTDATTVRVWLEIRLVWLRLALG